MSQTLVPWPGLSKASLLTYPARQTRRRLHTPSACQYHPQTRQRRRRNRRELRDEEGNYHREPVVLYARYCDASSRLQPV